MTAVIGRCIARGPVEVVAHDPRGIGHAQAAGAVAHLADDPAAALPG